MSTGCECCFVKVQSGEWFYILEDYNAPKNSWDWREHAEAFGPFSTEEAAEEHLFLNHANPGGSYSREYDPGTPCDEVEQKLFDAARKESARTQYGHYGYPRGTW